MTVQLVTRVPDSLAETIDRLVAEGVFSSRSEAVRTGLERLLEQQRRHATGQAIVDGYRRVPQDSDDLTLPDATAAAMIAEEPW